MNPAPDLSVSIPDVETALSLMFDQDQTIEIRAIGDRSSSSTVRSGYFNDRESLRKTILDLAENTRCLYWTMNQVKPELLARRENRVSIAELGKGEVHEQEVLSLKRIGECCSIRIQRRSRASSV